MNESLRELDALVNSVKIRQTSDRIIRLTDTKNKRNVNNRLMPLLDVWSGGNTIEELVSALKEIQKFKQKKSLQKGKKWTS